MARFPETNVRIPQCAFEALDEIADEHRISRDETVRRLLAAHVDEHERRAPPDRVSHISTVLRYPPAPRLARILEVPAP